MPRTAERHAAEGNATQLSRSALSSTLFNLTVTSEVVAGHNLYYLLVSTSSKGEFIIQRHSPTCDTTTRILVNLFLIATVTPDSSSSIVKENVDILTSPKLTDNT